jgi:hypothetical protein
MILTDFYKGEHLPESAKTRYDVVASTGSYEPFEIKLRNKKGEMFFYLTETPGTYKFSRKEKPDKAISKSDNISSLFVPDPSRPYAFGDIKGTQDAALFIIKDEWKTIELIIARGQRNNRLNLYHLLCDGELDHELEALRGRATSHELPK